jgi:hypothetical protein
MSAVELFSCAANALLTIPPHPTDFAVLARIAHVGIIPGQPFDASAFDADQLAQLQDGASEALEGIIAAVPTLGTETNGLEHEPLGTEAVPHAGFREQVPRSGRLGLELASQLGHVEAQVGRLRRVGGAPHLGEELSL